MEYFITSVRHPEYQLDVDNWYKWRLAYKGGRQFIRTYLQQLSTRETMDDFNNRMNMSYSPSFAKAALNDIKNAIYQRMTDVKRVGGSTSFTDCCAGRNGGVDLYGKTMNSFIGCDVLQELLLMRRVGVYVDMPQLDGYTLANTRGKHPYLYTYAVEDILSWELDLTDSPNQFQAVLLKDYVNTKDAFTGLPNGNTNRYRFMKMEDGVVTVQIFDDNGLYYDLDGNETGNEATFELKMSRIPFVMFEITSSLMEDVADYQIALLNIESSDIAYIMKMNFPFYVEQYDNKILSTLHLKNPEKDGTSDTANRAADNEIRVGMSTGRRYPMGANAPQFINPSAEPLKASMEKQDRMKGDIRLLVNLAVANLDPTMASAESKSYDERSLEAGLSYIGLELEKGERVIADIWAEYEGNSNPATIKYPERYSLKTNDDRRKDAQQLSDLTAKVPSRTFQKEVSKQIAVTLLADKIPTDTLNKIMSEIDTSKAVTSDPTVLMEAVLNGVLDNNLAATLLGFPEGTAEKAAQDHADKLQRIQESQTKASEQVDGAPRGVGPKAADPTAGKTEKQTSKDPATKKDPGPGVRGEGK